MGIESAFWLLRMRSAMFIFIFLCSSGFVVVCRVPPHSPYSRLDSISFYPPPPLMRKHIYIYTYIY